MPTVRSNISYAYGKFMRSHRATVRHIVKSVMAILAVAFLLETFLFNVNFYTSAGYNTVSLNDKLDLRETSDGQYQITAVNNVLEFSNVNAEVHNI